MRSTSCCTLTITLVRDFRPGFLSIIVLFEGLLKRVFFAKDISAVMRVMMILKLKDKISYSIIIS